ncbi:hypothetical protein BCR39DRAFT_504137 [Naematelia encephala]|uniref:Uncharacterized protein n=1 Tax=Naematelia encephala TaxID=71784 RepID=A0A1Y2BFE3_9TREE|nr:hypothetical protein BCR39DRAFT_504137 [Naematelia encephala]
MTSLNLPDRSLPGSPPSLLPSSPDATNKNLSKSLAFYKNLEIQKELMVAYATLINAWGFDGETPEELWVIIHLNLISDKFCKWFEMLYTGVVDLVNMGILSEDTRRIALTDVLTVHHIPHEPHLYLVVALRSLLLPSSHWQDWNDWPRDVEDLWGVYATAAGESAVRPTM